ncbi:cobalamin biosynthesis protein P47K [bacterium]|nr:cobalamin biosynthesis protein P47K [bacterium]
MTKPARTIRFIMVGGFLGAGKTTTLARLARHYTSQGLSVGIVTNDQASDLVDTNSLRSQGFDVGEVAGACFCCRFNDLIGSIQQLDQSKAPDVILAEPVGSCTDLVATVLQPLKQLYDAQFSVAPYAVLLKPSQGGRILRNEPGGGFSPKAAYILEKQLEEADLILINRVDELSPAEVHELHTLLDEKHPQTARLAVSAKTGDGFDAVLEFLDQQGDFGRRVLDIDYDIYADGEAELGWLNSSLRLHSEQSFTLDDVLLEIVQSLQQSLSDAGFEAAHLKTIGLWEGFFGVANLISTAVAPELSLPSHSQVKECELVVNARVACDPLVLAQQVQNAIQRVCADHGITATEQQTQQFRPGRPMPTHRLQPA